MKKSITQKHQFGCGIACTAFVLDISYKKALSLFDNSKNKVESFGFVCKEIVNVLNPNFYKYGYLKKNRKNIIYFDKTIVFIKRTKLYPYGYYLVRFGGFWMDPWINFKINSDIRRARSGFRKRLPGKPIYYITKKIRF